MYRAQHSTSGQTPHKLSALRWLLAAWPLVCASGPVVCHAQSAPIRVIPKVVAAVEDGELFPVRLAPEIQRLPLVEQLPKVGALTDAAAASVGRIALASGISFDSQTGTLTIRGTDSNDTASVMTDTNGDIVAFFGLRVARYAPNSVKSIVFYGEDGADTFTNATNIPSTINGGDGDDLLNGGSAADFIVGGYGQDIIHGNAGPDTLWGSGGSDQIYGDDGNDVIFGHGGADQIHGGAGRDTLNGGSGNDTFWGDSGNDLIVTVGGGADTITGGSQWDNFWVDASDTITDVSPNEQDLGYVHVITKFRSVKRQDGSFQSVGLEPAGEDLPDPAKYDNHTGSLTDFSDHPLFASIGPNKDDIFQGSVGDCYFMSRLSAFAMQDPEYIRKLVAPLGDGSYAVRFFRDGAEDYVRVDSDFWAQGGKLLYADEGQEGALWVPVVEKAFAIARRDQATYASISGGNGTTLSNLKYEMDSTVINDGLTALQVEAWHAGGAPAGTIRNTLEGSVKFLLLVIDYYLNEGYPMLTGAVAGIKDSTPIRATDDPNTSSNEVTYRRGQHIYQVDHVDFDTNGDPVSLVLRDPYGLYRTITDPTRLHFCIGRASWFTL